MDQVEACCLLLLLLVILVLAHSPVEDTACVEVPDGLDELEHVVLHLTLRQAFATAQELRHGLERHGSHKKTSAARRHGRPDRRHTETV